LVAGSGTLGWDAVAANLVERGENAVSRSTFVSTGVWEVFILGYGCSSFSTLVTLAMLLLTGELSYGHGVNGTNSRSLLLVPLYVVSRSTAQM
jgi:hypothetical protein